MSGDQRLLAFCWLTALFFHTGADRAIQLAEKRSRMPGLSRSGASRPWCLVAGRVARPRRLAKAVAKGLGLIGWASEPLIDFGHAVLPMTRQAEGLEAA